MTDHDRRAGVGHLENFLHDVADLGVQNRAESIAIEIDRHRLNARREAGKHGGDAARSAEAKGRLVGGVEKRQVQNRLEDDRLGDCGLLTGE